MGNNSTASKNILLLGNGGHCASVLDVLLERPQYKRIGIVIPNGEQYVAMDGAEWAGYDEDLPRLRKEGFEYGFVAVGSIGDTSIRRRLTAYLLENGYRIPSILSSSAAVSHTCTIEDGIFIGKNAVVNRNAHIDQCAIINSGAIIEHNCSIGPFSHVSPGATICGDVVIEQDVHIGANAVVLQGLRIGQNTQIGAGSVVTHDISDNMIAYGVPCKEIRGK